MPSETIACPSPLELAVFAELAQLKTTQIIGIMQRKIFFIYNLQKRKRLSALKATKISLIVYHKQEKNQKGVCAQ
jgi:hypothetical protein